MRQKLLLRESKKASVIGRFVHLVLETFPDLSIIQFLHPGAFHRSLTSNITFMFDVITLLVWNSEF